MRAVWFLGGTVLGVITGFSAATGLVGMLALEAERNRRRFP